MTDTKPPEQNEQTNPSIRHAFVQLLNPIALVAILILVSILVLIGAALFGWDRGGILKQLAGSDFARGLITYLFAVGTIGTAVVLVLAALLGGPAVKERFDNGKEILSLLIGVFGTIIGFYYGSEVAASATAVQPAGELQVAEVLFSDSVGASGQSVMAMTVVSGGAPPYRYWISTDTTARPNFNAYVGSNGVVSVQLTVPASGAAFLPVLVAVVDSQGDTARTAARLRVAARQ
jgi:hypothetical protein